MAYFSISKGKEENLPSTILNGNCYFCTDTSNFYIDYTDTDGTLVRSKISSKYAEKLRYSVDGNIIEIDPSEITDLKTTVSTIFKAPISHLLMSSIDYRIIIYEKKQVQIVIPSGILFLDLQPVCLLADTLPLGLRTQRYISAQKTAH